MACFEGLRPTLFAVVSPTTAAAATVARTRASARFAQSQGI